MDELQALLYADGNQSLLVVLQALDAAGKDGIGDRPRFPANGNGKRGPSPISHGRNRSDYKML